MHASQEARPRRATGIASRMVGLFVLTALAPIVVLTLQFRSYLVGQLEEGAAADLQSSARQLGRGIEAEAEHVRQELHALVQRTLLAPGAAGDVAAPLRLTPARGSVLGEVHWFPAEELLAERLGPLSVAERTRLQRGEPVWRAAPGERLQLVEALAGDPRRGFIAAECGTQAWIPPPAPDGGDLAWALTHPDGRLWLGSGSPAESLACCPRGALPWLTHAGEDFLVHAEPWTLASLGPGFELRTARRRAEILAPLRAYRWRVALIALGSLFVALLLGTLQIRRLLDPIRRLRLAAQRFGADDWQQRVDIRTHDEFAELGATFNRMAERIASMREEEALVRGHLIEARDRALHAMRTEKEFVQNVSHELLTPLTSMRSFLEILQDHRALEEDATDEFLNIVMQESAKLERLLQRILEFNELGSESGTLRLESLRLQDLLSEAVAGHREAATQRSVRLRLRSTLRAERVLVDRAGFAEVLHELLDNALTHSPEGGEVAVEASAHDGVLRIRVRDQGTGVRPEDRERIFEPFRQATPDSMTEKPRGAGLGLTLARGILDRFAATLQQEEQAGGACFLIEIAAYTGEALEIDEAVGAPGLDAAPSLLGHARESERASAPSGRLTPRERP